MALHPALKKLIDEKIANSPAPQWELPLEEVRASFHNLWIPPKITGDLVEVASVEDKTIDTDAGPLKVRVFVPENDGPLPLMMYFHGGGYVKGGIWRRILSAAGWQRPRGTSSYPSTTASRPRTLTRQPSMTHTLRPSGPTNTPGNSGGGGNTSASAVRAPAATWRPSFACCCATAKRRE